MFCRKCGKQLNDNVKFCTYCGSEVNVVPLSPEELEKKRLEAQQKRIEEEQRRAQELEQRRIQEEQRRIEEENRRRIEEERRRQAAEELARKKEEQKAKRKAAFKKFGIPILISAGAVIVLGIAAAIVVPIVKQKVAEEKQRQYEAELARQDQARRERIATALRRYDEPGLLKKINEIKTTFYSNSREDIFVINKTGSMGSLGSYDLLINNDTLNIDELILHHRIYHLGNIPYESEEYGEWLYYSEGNGDMTCCPFCRYAANHKGESVASAVYRVDKDTLYKYLTAYDILDYLGLPKTDYFSIISGVDSSRRQGEDFRNKVKRYAEKLEIPSMEFSSWSQKYEKNSGTFRSNYDGKKIHLYGTANNACTINGGGSRITVGYTSYYWDIFPINCYFTSSYMYDTLKEYEGSTISIIGTVDVGYLSFSLDDCEIFTAETFNSPTKLKINKCAYPIENLMLRSYGSKSAKKIGKLQADSIVKILQKGPADKINGIQGNWYKVKVLSGAGVVSYEGSKTSEDDVVKGTEGWCFGGYLFDCAYDTSKVIVNGITVSN